MLNAMSRKCNGKFLTVTIFSLIVLYYFVFQNRSDIVEIYANQIYRRVKYEEVNIASSDIQIVIVIGATTKLDIYKHALDTLKCYCAIHGYPLRIVLDNMFESNCTQKDKFFRRHCVVAHLLEDAEYTLFLDADVGVVNPKKKIQAFIDRHSHITHYDRFFNHEISAGGYIAKNSQWAFNYLMKFANWESKLPESFHGTDNGALHLHVAEVLFPDREHEYYYCTKLYNRSRNFEDLSVFVACMRTIIGAQECHGNIRILEKGTGWARDNWLTNSKWNPEYDFMIHGWKTDQLMKLGKLSHSLKLKADKNNRWYNPLVGNIDLELCTPENLTWNYDTQLIDKRDKIEDRLTILRREVDSSKFKRLASIAAKLQT